MRKLEEDRIIKPELDVGLFFRKINASLPGHMLDFYKLMYVFDGSGLFTIRGRGYPVRAGSVFCVPPDTPHTFMTSGETVYCDIAVRKHIMESREMAELFREPDANDGRILPDAAYADSRTAREIGHLLELMRLEQEEKPKDYKKAMLLDLMRLTVLIRRSPASPPDPGSSKAPLPVIKDYINANLTERSTLRQVAQKYSYSPAHLSRLFSKSEGMSYTRYVKERRLEYARQLLRESVWSASEIAQMAGYTNKTLFFRFFKEKYGMTPDQYRKLNKPKY